MVPGTSNALYNKLNYRNDFFAFRGISNLGTALPFLGREGLVWLERRKSRRPSLSPLPPPLGKGGGRKRGIPMNALESRRREKEISGMGIPAKTGWKRKRERKVAEKPYQTKKIPCKMSRNNSNSTFESRAVLVLVPPELLFHVWSTCFV